jgi:ABC-2 type transport system ATP-binding protein
VSIVLLHEVSKRFEATLALDRLSLRVAPGELVGLIGPDGAGKTTALRLMGGLLAPDSGRVEVFGLEPARARRQLADRIGYLSQGAALYGDLTVDENLAFFAEIHRRFDHRARREQLLDLMGLTAARTRLADRLSGGMRQKLALACALVHDPALLLLDEPTTGVDPVSRREVWKLLWTLAADGITIVLTTTYLEEAERCSRVGLLYEGRLVAFDEPARLIAECAGDIVEVVASPPEAARRELTRVVDPDEVDTLGDRLRVRVAAGEGRARAEALAGRLRAAGVHVERAGPVAPSLEDVFIERVARRTHRAAAAPSGPERP